jgi:signal transduction histidine kinase
MAAMPASATAAATASQAKPPRNPISRRQIETVASRSVAIFGLVFGAQTVPTTIEQLSLSRDPWAIIIPIAIYGGLLLTTVASISKQYVRATTNFFAFSWLVAMVCWPLTVNDPHQVATERPWLWFLCTVATAAAALSLSTLVATAYLIVAPVAYGVVRTLPSGGGKDFGSAALDTAYAVILGGAILIIITLLRQAAAAVDSAQTAALDRYAHAVRQHATEVERVQVDAIVHDSVLTTLLSAAQAFTPESKDLATRMAKNAMGHLKDAASAAPDDDATVRLTQLAHRIMGATATLSAPFELRTKDLSQGVLPVQAAEAVYSAAVQAMVNSLQHAGQSAGITRWLSIRGKASGGIQVDIGDTGSGFAVGTVPTERLGLRISIIERVANAGGTVEIDSSIGEGTVISIHWPSPDNVDDAIRVHETAELPS